MTPETQSVDGRSIVWQDPPPWGADTHLVTPGIAAALRARPGKWAMIKVREGTHTSTDSKASHPSDIEIRCRYRQRDGVKWVEVYARAVKP